jgi:hypothetical protein
MHEITSEVELECKEDSMFAVGFRKFSDLTQSSANLGNITPSVVQSRPVMHRTVSVMTQTNDMQISSCSQTDDMQISNITSKLSNTKHSIRLPTPCSSTTLHYQPKIVHPFSTKLPGKNQPNSVAQVRKPTSATPQHIHYNQYSTAVQHQHCHNHPSQYNTLV